jgi:glutamate synthase (NADPH/NADH) small chain
VLGLNDDAVTIRENEQAIVEAGFSRGLIKAAPPEIRTGKESLS